MSKHKDKIINKLVNDLNAADTEVVLNALSAIREKGNIQLIPTLIFKLLTTDVPEIKKELTLLFAELKDQACVEPIMKAVNSDASIGNRHILISTFWQSTLNGKAYFDDFINHAISGDLATCIECVSVIEHLAELNDEKIITDAIIKIKKTLSTPSEKSALLMELIEMLQTRLME